LPIKRVPLFRIVSSPTSTPASSCRAGHHLANTLYGLRHFMATQLGAVAEAGTARERMGHGSLAVTSGDMHRVSEADRAAAEYMGALLDRDR
jgi:hypothetical protein